MNALWQLGTVAILDAQRNFWTRHSRGLYVVAAAPMLPALCLLMPSAPPLELEEIPTAFAIGFQSGVIPLMVFFACAGVFSDLFRRDITDHSLHYWLLAPIRRELVALGKFLGALVMLSCLFGTSTACAYVAYYLPNPSGRAWHLLLAPQSFAAMGSYVAATVLAVLGYGALFFVVGMFFKSPVLPALGLWLWEAINQLLPSFLKHLSVIHYVKAFFPVHLTEGLFALGSEPPAAWVALLTIPAFAVACVAVAIVRVRTIEVTYGVD